VLITALGGKEPREADPVLIAVLMDRHAGIGA
jgi:hypothetical protein